MEMTSVRFTVLAGALCGLAAISACGSGSGPSPGGAGGSGGAGAGGRQTSNDASSGGAGGSSPAAGGGGSGGGAAGNGGAGGGGGAGGSGGTVTASDAGADAPADAPPKDGGGGTSCGGFAVSFNANVAANSDPAKARVVVAFNGSADLPTGNANRTVEFWAYVLPSSWAADANTMFFYGTNNRVADGFGLDFGVSMGTMGTIDPFTNAIFDNDNQPSGLNASASQWAHFAMTWDGTTVRAFVNGVQRASKAAPATSAQKTLMTGATALTIGGYDPAYFNGYMDEMRVWNVARSAADIASTMNHTLVGNETGLTGYWKFDEGTGTRVADSVTSAGHVAHPGTLMANIPGNLPTWVPGPPLTCP
jgi:large repetitive protein